LDQPGIHVWVVEELYSSKISHDSYSLETRHIQ